jgi:hypothetical protein
MIVPFPSKANISIMILISGSKDGIKESGFRTIRFRVSTAARFRHFSGIWPHLTPNQGPDASATAQLPSRVGPSLLTSRCPSGPGSGFLLALETNTDKGSGFGIIVLTTSHELGIREYSVSNFAFLLIWFAHLG